MGGREPVFASSSRCWGTQISAATNTGSRLSGTLANIERLVFSDATIALTMEGINAGSDPSASYNALAEKLYVGYFGRPADPGGFQNMTAQLSAAAAPTDMQAFVASYGSNAAVRGIIDGFGNSAESGRLYTGSNVVVADNFTIAIVNATGYRGSIAAQSARDLLHSVGQDTNVFDYQAAVDVSLVGMGAASAQAV